MFVIIFKIDNKKSKKNNLKYLYLCIKKLSRSIKHVYYLVISKNKL